MASPSTKALAVLLLFLGTADCGCVRRRMTVRTNPPGARVFIDRQEIGETPVSTGFTYYGTRELRIERDGYETIKQSHKINPPWYQMPGLDFITENLWPYELRDERELHFQMQPQRVVPTEEIMGRAEDLRRQAHPGQMTSFAPSFNGTGPIPSSVDPSPALPPVMQPSRLPPPAASSSNVLPPVTTAPTSPIRIPQQERPPTLRP